jgi:DNA-directed RNA polymerase specialized sigma24 family protein
MPDGHDDPPNDDNDASDGDDDGSSPDADADDDADAGPPEPFEGYDPSEPPLPPAVVHRFLASTRALKIVKKVLRGLVPKQQVEDLATDALLRAIKAPAPPHEDFLPGWLATIARRRAADWLRKRKRREKHEGAMPARAAGEDAYTGEAIHDGDDGDPSYDPTTVETPVELLGEELDRLIGSHVRDAEVRAMVRESDDGKTYAQIAAARGLTERQVANRILRFKVKYTARVKRERLWTLLVKLAWGAGALAVAAAVVAIVLYFRRPRTEDIGPDPSRAVPSAPSASASAPVFLQALPPVPEPSAPPDDGSKPKPPRP